MPVIVTTKDIAPEDVFVLYVQQPKEKKGGLEAGQGNRYRRFQTGGPGPKEGE